MIKKIFLIIFILSLFVINLNTSYALDDDIYPDSYPPTFTIEGDKPSENIHTSYFYLSSSGKETPSLIRSMYFPITLGSQYFQMFIPLISTIDYGTVGILSELSIIEFYDVDMELIETYKLGELQADPFETATDYGRWYFEQDDTYFKLENASYFVIQFKINLSLFYDLGFITWLYDRFDYQAEIELTDLIISGDWDGNSMTYYIGATPYYKTSYDDIPDKPYNPPTLATLVFDGWKRIDNTPYNFRESFDPEYTGYEEYTVLYAKLRFISNPSDNYNPSGTDYISSINSFLSSVGLNTTFGKILIYSVISLIMVGIMLFFKFNTFIILLFALLVLLLFMFLQFLPVWFYVSILLGLLVMAFSKTPIGIGGN